MRAVNLCVAFGILSSCQAFVAVPKHSLLTTNPEKHASRFASSSSKVCSKQIQCTTTTLQLQSSSSSSSSADKDESPGLSMSNVPAAVTWVALLTFAFFFAPGSLTSPDDKLLLDNIIANPTNPGMNELYYFTFNLFAVAPVIMASVLLPQGQKNKGLPAGPFLFLSSFIGFFAMGPFLALRAPPKTEMTSADVSEMSWITKNVFENKLFSASVIAFTFYLVAAINVIPAILTDPAGQWQGFVELVTTSRFCSVSMVDLTILYVTCIGLTPLDYKLRNPSATDAEANKVALLSALLPFLGSAIYCAVRPSLPFDEEN